MDFLRQFADAGTAVMVISAIGRTKDSKGRSSYAGEGLNLASFRESSELEFGCAQCEVHLVLIEFAIAEPCNTVDQW